MLKENSNKISPEGKTIVNNFLSLTMLQAANYILPLIILPFLVRVLGTDKFGLVMFAQSLVMILNMAVEFGFGISGTREVSLVRQEKDKVSQVFSTIMSIKFLLVILGLLVLIVVVESFDKFSSNREIYYYSYGLVIGNALFPSWFFRGIEKMKFVTLINVFAKLVFTILIFLLIKEESDYFLVPIYNSFGFILAGFVGFLLSLKRIKLVLPKISLMKKYINENFSLFIAKFASNLYTSCNVLILGLFVDNTIVGVYSSIEKFVLAIKAMYGPLYQSIFPWLVKQNPLKQIKTIRKIMPLVFSLGVLVVLVVFMFGKEILDLIYNNELITSYSFIFKILSFIAVFSGLNMLFSSLYFTSIKKYNLRMSAFISTGFFNLVLSFILVPVYGIIGIASSVAISELFLLVICWYYYRRHLKTI